MCGYENISLQKSRNVEYVVQNANATDRFRLRHVMVALIEYCRFFPTDQCPFFHRDNPGCSIKGPGSCL